MIVQAAGGHPHNRDGSASRQEFIIGWSGVRVVTLRDRILADFRALQDIRDRHGGRAAAHAAAENEPDLLWTIDTRARLAARLAALNALPADVGELSVDDPRRWAAERARTLLGMDLTWREGGNLRTMTLDEVEQVRGRVLARIELLYEVVDILLDWSGAPQAYPTDDPPAKPGYCDQ